MKYNIQNFKKWTKSELFEFLNECDFLYYSDNDFESRVDDTTYDIIKTYAQEIYPKHRYFKKIGVELKNSDYIHDLIIGSLTKYKNDPNDNMFIQKWLNKYPNKLIVVTPKLDGLSIRSKIDNYKQKESATRGDGTNGKNITYKASVFLPEFKLENYFDLRGEIYLPGDLYLKLEKKNRRNAASGLIGRDTIENIDKLKVIYHEIINTDYLDIYESTEQERLDLLIKLVGQENAIPYKIVNSSTVTNEELEEILNEWKEKYNDIIDLDGLVLTLNESIRENEYHPEMKISYKVNESEGFMGIVDYIEWNTSRTGRVVPKVILKEPVDVLGSSIKRITAYNAKYVKENNLQSGSKVWIIRSGDVIPKIIKVEN